MREDVRTPHPLLTQGATLLVWLSGFQGRGWWGKGSQRASSKAATAGAGWGTRPKFFVRLCVFRVLGEAHRLHRPPQLIPLQSCPSGREYEASTPRLLLSMSPRGKHDVSGGDTHIVPLLGRCSRCVAVVTEECTKPRHGTPLLRKPLSLPIVPSMCGPLRQIMAMLHSSRSTFPPASRPPLLIRRGASREQLPPLTPGLKILPTTVTSTPSQANTPWQTHLQRLGSSQPRDGGEGGGEEDSS